MPAPSPAVSSTVSLSSSGSCDARSWGSPPASRWASVFKVARTAFSARSSSMPARSRTSFMNSPYCMAPPFRCLGQPLDVGRRTSERIDRHLVLGLHETEVAVVAQVEHLRAPVRRVDEVQVAVTELLERVLRLLERQRVGEAHRLDDHDVLDDLGHRHPG